MILLDGSSLTLEQLIDIADRGERVGLSDAARRRVQASRDVVERRARNDEPAYGINTGFGSFADVKIAPEALETLQLNLLRSHAAGVGDPLPVRTVRAMMALRANVLAKGFSGISLPTLDALIAMLNDGVHPRVPSRGSVGASGDLAPLAHLALVLVGEGEVLDAGSEGPGLRDVGRVLSDPPRRTPIRLGPKEGLALINGTQASTAVLALALAGAEQLARAADIAAALSIDALRGSIHPFEARIHDARPFRGQRTSAANIDALMRGSGINKSHEFCGRVQDAYSMRCAAQVHGATREALRFVRDTVVVEANAATDNPMVFADSGDIVSGGNFHGAPIAIAADLLASAIVPLATISERRTDRLVDPTLSDLPAFLTREGGVNSGFMMAQVTAAAVASELKSLAHPAGVDTIPTSANKEDHVSMSMTAALKADTSVRRAREVVAIEILCACQAMDFLAPLTSSPVLEHVRALVRSRVPMLESDRPPAPDIVAITELIASNALEDAAGGLVK
ncbi:MAG TPA: histidine ammonia-lyase [Vicinamibacterales bacterium]|nr:histidine ammonia-lyase [Vicinamibacterales bacterium]